MTSQPKTTGFSAIAIVTFLVVAPVAYAGIILALVLLLGANLGPLEFIIITAMACGIAVSVARRVNRRARQYASREQ